MPTPEPNRPRLPALPANFAATREALRALACYVIAPVRKGRTGRIGLRAVGDGFGTPPFGDGSRIFVHGDQLVHEPAGSASITSLRAAAEFLDYELTPDPGVGKDLPQFAPDAPLGVDAAASFALGAWYGFAQQVLDGLGAGTEPAVGEAQLWPEHFDLAVTVDVNGRERVNVGFSPGDGFNDDPYIYVGPHDIIGLSGAFWNAPFGAYLSYETVRVADDPAAAAAEFIRTGLGFVAQRDSSGQ